MADDGPRNPFGEMDVPDPDDASVTAFSATTVLDGKPDDQNAERWCEPIAHVAGSIEGDWASRWNGGADPAVPDDLPERWKTGRAEVRSVDRRVYIRFDWHGGSRRGLIDAERQNAGTLVGKYINLTNPSITRPWVGLIVSAERIDGHWTNGRLDFRR